jgi:DNA-directed RNA polymerase subunit M/transcription elongation factor TFIIS
MEFCEKCDNMLYVKVKSIEEADTDGEDSTGEVPNPGGILSNLKTNQLIYYCKNCSNEIDKSSVNKCIYHINYDIDVIKKEHCINKYTLSDPTLPKAHGIKCPNGNCPGKKPNIVYIKYDDKGMKYIYICVNCFNANISPHIW